MTQHDPREGWRLGTDHSAASGRAHFDEIVVGSWLHVERMNAGEFWMRVGDCTIDIAVDRYGKARLRFRDERLADGYEQAIKNGGLRD